MPSRKTRPTRKKNTRKKSRKGVNTKKPLIRKPQHKTMDAKIDNNNNGHRDNNNSKNDHNNGGYHPGVQTHWGDPNNNWLLPQVGQLPSSSGEKHTGTNWLGTEVDWT